MQELLFYNNDEIVIQANGKVYQDTKENFLLDYGKAIPQMSVAQIVQDDEGNKVVAELQDITIIDYNRTVQSCWLNGHAFQEYPNKVCEDIMNGIDTLLANRKERKHVEPTLETLKAEKHNAAGAAFAEKRDAIRWIELSNGNEYGFDCANEDITNFFASWKAAEKTGQTPYKVWLDENTKGMIIMPLADFDTVFDAVRDSQLEAYAWYNEIAAQIAAATTKEELESIVLE